MINVAVACLLPCDHEQTRQALVLFTIQCTNMVWRHTQKCRFLL